MSISSSSVPSNRTMDLYLFSLPLLVGTKKYKRLNNMILKKILLLVVLLLATTAAFSQSFNVEQVGKSKLINVSGGFSANSVFYSGNAPREPFTYFLNGNINLNIANLYNLPFSFSYSNLKFGYNKPVLINRLSIHPSYKWITAHIGDVSMSFSPYTLSGHQFSGVGIDLTPQGNFKVSAMYGRLLKSSEYDSTIPSLIPNYKRYGYGFKTAYTLNKINLGLTFFKAKDVNTSLTNPIPFELGITPKENSAISFETSFNLYNKLQVVAEFANSSITEDTREAGSERSKGMASLFLNSNNSTKNYKAIKTQLIYPAGNGTLGLGYERIDPNYRTLGGYFFNNDLENITLNATQNLYNNKITLALNAGLQKDDLEDQKKSQSKRLVSSVNLGLKPNEKLNIDLSYSNFQSFTNSKNQFDYINQTSQFDNLDTLNYRQVTQNATFNLNYLLRNEKTQKRSMGINLSVQDAVNQQQGQTLQGGASTFYNSALSYLIGYPDRSLNIVGALNSTFSHLDASNNLILGPTLGVNKNFMDKKVSTSFSSSYNTSFSDGKKQTDVFNFRLSGNYLLQEKHNFNMAILSLFSKRTTGSSSDLTATLTYSYSFDKIKIKRLPKETLSRERDTLAAIIKINYNKITLEGTRESILQQLKTLQQNIKPIPPESSNKLDTLLSTAQKTSNDKQFKEKVYDYLEALEANTNNAQHFNQSVTNVIQKLRKELQTKDKSIEHPYKLALAKVNSHPAHDIDKDSIQDKVGYRSYLKLLEHSKISGEKLLRHRWMLAEFTALSKMDETELELNEYLNSFKMQESDEAFKMISNKEKEIVLEDYLEQHLIPFYHALAIKNTIGKEASIR